MTEGAACDGEGKIAVATDRYINDGSPKQEDGTMLKTPWTDVVDQNKPWPEYPRPQMVRSGWVNLNGPWDYAIVDRNMTWVTDWEGTIIVPFPAESYLSGVQRRVGPDNRLWYRRTFAAPAVPPGGRLLLHFGAVDWEAEVWVNGRHVGVHRGGFVPFTFDITPVLRDTAEQELVVAVWDPTDEGDQPRGKQTHTPKGIWYEAVTGIWQTVWLEAVPAVWIADLAIVPDIDAGVVKLRAMCDGAGSVDTVQFCVRDGNKTVAEGNARPSEEVSLPVPDAKLWTPDEPHLYDLTVQVIRDGQAVDEVTSYFGMRKISVGSDKYGRPKLLLNNEVVFQYGLLDQGWWPDGLYTAPTDEALVYDIQATKALGFNMIRKHVKVEPARWYYHCDRLGILVWQDMPNAAPDREEARQFWVHPRAKHDAERSVGSSAQFEDELRCMIDALRNHPSIVVWVPFNEGWGQYDTVRITKWVEQYDPTRLTNAVSGWTDRGTGHIFDIHEYPGPAFESKGDGRVPVLGEFGGLALPVPGHLWTEEGNWGYRSYSDQEALMRKYTALLKSLHGPLALGLAAAIYTQTTDVEREVNGLITYDRKLVKVDKDTVRALHAELHQELPPPGILLPTCVNAPHRLRLVTGSVNDDWMQLDYDTGQWTEADCPIRTGPFLEAVFPAGSPWEGDTVRFRRKFVLTGLPTYNRLWLELMCTADEVTIYLNGHPVLQATQPRPYERHYRHLDISEFVHLLREGTNIVAVYATKREGERGIDVGLYGLGG